MKSYFACQKEIKFDFVYLLVLSILLFVVSFPNFLYPPASDYWTLLYFFHHLDELPELPGSNQWLHCLNWDPNEQMNYRPLFGLYYYVLHRLFGASFIFFNIVNFLFYFFSVIILYQFARYFTKNRVLTAVFIGFFAFVFNHFDIVLWSFHIHIIVGFCMFLLGFIVYLRFLKTGRLRLLFVTILLFLIGMLSYETFFLWPFAIVILSGIKNLRGEGGPGKGRIVRSNLLILGITYAVYVLFFFFTRSLGTYESPPREISDFLQLLNFIPAGLLTLFNILYNTIAVNIYPLLPFPFKVTENIYLAGPVINYIAKGHKDIVFMGGALAGILLVAVFIYLRRKRYFEEMKIIGLFLFLILSETYILFFVRLSLNVFEYSLTEFRYQYIPNAFAILTILFIIDRFLKLTKKRKRILYSVLTLLLVLNIYCVRRVMNIYHHHFANLKEMVANIRADIREGSINQDNKLFIADDIPEYLPSLCWNIWMGEMFVKKGTYHWMFSKEEVQYFSWSPEDATWVIDKEDFKVIKKSFATSFKKEQNVDSGKDQQYVELGHFYGNQGEYEKAQARFKRAIAINPRNDKAYHGLGVCYRVQARYKEVEALFKKAVEINPRNAQVYADLGHLYKGEERYEEAEAMFKKAIEIDPKNRSAYHGLEDCYNSQGRYQEAKKISQRHQR